MKAVPLGRALVRAGLVTTEDLADAVDAQRREGGLIGQHLILAGAVTRRDMYGVLARQWRAPLVDLVAEPPDPALLDDESYEVVDRGWIPWRREGDVAIIATSVPPTGERLLNMRAATGASTIVLRSATDWDVFQAVSLVRRVQLTMPTGTDDRDGVSWPGSRLDDVVRRVTAPALVLGAVAVAVWQQPLWTTSVLLVLANLTCLAVVSFAVLATARSWRHPPALPGTGAGEHPVDLPVYSVLVPVVGDVHDVDLLLRHVDTMDYPKAKLEVILLVDEHDDEAFGALKQLSPAPWVKILQVPSPDGRPGGPAHNYGLAFARGHLVVVYRPTDRPEPAQLLRAAAVLTGTGRDARLVCVQATVRCPEPRRSLVTRILAVEQATWFGSVLPVADAWGIPVPLGGHSEHFVARDLRALGAWSADDLTDGSDLAIRASAARRTVAVMGSTTEAHACDDLGGWMDERVRWIAGCLMTATSRSRLRGRRRAPLLRVAGAGLMMVANPLVFLAFPVAVATALMTLALVDGLEGQVPSGLVAAQLTALALGVTLVAALSGLVAAREYGWRVGVVAMLAPLYWCLQTWAAVRAAGRLLLRSPRR